jgi:iron complex transport system ATP-binding protein
MLDVEAISVSYGASKVLRDITFSVDKGECIGIIGPNGSGKSTLLKALSKILKPSSGKVVICGRDLERYTVKELARHMAVVPQETGIEFDFTCLEIVLMGRNPHMGRFEVEGKKDMDIAREAMVLTNTWHLRDRPFSRISGGERQRVIIARALAQEPSVLLMDEPVSHLDINYQIEILELVERLKEERRIVVIIVFHDLNLAARYCDRLILLSDSSILAAGKPEDVLTQEHIHDAFHANVVVRKHPLTGYMYVTPLNSCGAEEPSNGRTIHLICGAGTGTRLMYLLRSKGYSVTAGVLNVLDSDHDTAAHLNIKTVSEAPFSPITPESYGQLVEMMKKANAIVITDVPIGWGNLKNLQAVIEAKPGALYIIENDREKRDYTNGEATRILEALKASGAIAVNNADELMKALGTF